MIGISSATSLLGDGVKYELDAVTRLGTSVDLGSAIPVVVVMSHFEIQPRLFFHVLVFDYTLSIWTEHSMDSLSIKIGLEWVALNKKKEK